MNLIEQDLIAWCEWKQKKYGICSFLYFFFVFKEFRRLVDYRLKKTKLVFLRLLLKPFLGGLNLYFACREGCIGGGLRIMHGYSTTVLVKKMGTNCMINQNVTIGWSYSGIPTIGHDVWIAAGAVVCGGISVGDDVVIGANSVVTKDIPSHCMVAGNPAKIIKRRENMNEPWKKVKDV